MLLRKSIASIKNKKNNNKPDFSVLSIPLMIFVYSMLHVCNFHSQIHVSTVLYNLYVMCNICRILVPLLETKTLQGAKILR